MSTAKKAASIAVSVVMWIIILMAALFAFTTLATKDDGSVSNFAGFTPLAVQSESMAPTFQEGDLIVIQQCDPATLKEGDVVTFHTIIDNQYALNTHRIVSIDEVNGTRSFTTKGDNNELTDQHVIADGDIVGKYVFTIPFMGKVIDFLSSSVGFLIVIVIPMLLFFIYQVYHLVIVGMNLKRAMAEEDRMKAAAAIVDGEDAAARAGAPKAAAGAVAGGTGAAAGEASSAATSGNAASAASDAAAAAGAAPANDAAADRARAEEALAEAKRLKAEAEAMLAAAEKKEAGNAK